jgi:mono/diheme cytochrome c family protein
VKRFAFLMLVMSSALAGCRGQPSDKQPLHLFPDMDYQPKYQAQESSALPNWKDRLAMREPVEGTVAREQLREDDGYFTGMVGKEYLAKVPVKVDETLIRRGQERYNIYCAPCHDRSGSGQGMVVKRGYPTATNLTAERVRMHMPDGQIYTTISRGIRQMPAYRVEIPVPDRWAIVAWVRVLQQSQHASLADVPETEREKIKPEVPNQ